MKKSVVSVVLILFMGMICASCGRTYTETLTTDSALTEDVAVESTVPVETEPPVTEHPETNAPETTPLPDISVPETEPIVDEKLRYNVISVCFLGWFWNGGDYYLTNSEINEFLDAIASLDFSEEYEGEILLGGDLPCVIKTDSESYGLSLPCPQIYIFPDDSFSINSRISAKHYQFDEDSAVFVFINKLREQEHSKPNRN